MNRILFIFLLILTSLPSYCQKQNEKDISFLLLGDIHYDLLEDHDMTWLSTKPDDLRQVTEEYSVFTKNTWPEFSRTISRKVQKHQPVIKAILQMGDLSEGLAGSPQKAIQMANSAFNAVNKMDLKIPFIMTKGNHDITGPGAKEAFEKVYLPNMAKLAGHKALRSANYTTTIDDVLFVCYDPWERNPEGLQQLEKLLTDSKASYKFVMLHEPVIPVNERCWHVFRQDNAKREQLLQIIASQRAIILCAHLHVYSVVCRNTSWGPIVQILTNSVVKDKKMLSPKNVVTDYSNKLVTSHPQWQPSTLQQRIEWIDKETPHIRFFKQMDLPGYGVLSIDKENNNIQLEYYAAFGEEPYDTINISELLTSN